MSIKEKLSEEKWKSLFNAPGAAASFVSTASGGGFEMFQEIFAASKFMQNLSLKESGSGYGSIVDELISAMKGMSLQDARSNTIQYQSKDLESLRAEAKKVVADGVAVAKTLPESDGYMKWILDVARQVAEAKTGGFLGIGGKSVIDEQEQAALKELAELSAL